MDILRNLFGSLTSGIIRLVVTVGILAAVYFLLLKPVLHTTDKAIDSANKTFEKSFGTPAGLNDVDKTLQEVNRRVQREIRHAFKATPAHNANKLVKCIEHANGDVRRIEHCTKRF
jgi:hypothetical protein